MKLPPWFIKHYIWLVPMLIAIGVGLITIDGGFTYDDETALVVNPIVSGEVPWHEAFVRDVWGKLHVSEPIRTYRPLSPLLWRITWFVSSGSPWGFHLLSLFLHVFAVLVFIWVGHKLVDDKKMLCIAAVLFALHPAHAEAVGSNVGQSDVLSTILGMVALGFALVRGHWLKTGAAVLLLIAACLVKESAFIFGGIIVLVLLLEKNSVLHLKVRRAIPFVLATMAIILLQLSLERSTVDWRNNVFYASEGMDRVWLGFSMVGRAVQMLTVPYGMAPNHGYASIELNPDAAVLLGLPGLIIVVVLLCAFIYSVRRRSIAGAILTALLLGPILLVSNLIIPIPSELPERILYPATAAISALGAAAIIRFLKSTKLQYLVITLVVAFWGIQNYRAQRPWHSSVSLWEYAVQIEPKALRSQVNLASLYFGMDLPHRAAWHWILSAYIYNHFPHVVDWRPVETLEILPMEHRWIVAPGRLDPIHGPCKYVHGMMTTVRNTAPRHEQMFFANYSNHYPACFPGLGKSGN